MSRFAVNKATERGRQRTPEPRPRRRHPGRRVLGIGIILVTLVTIGAFLADTAVAMRSEHSFSRALLSSPHVIYDPEVTISGFPFISHSLEGDFAGAVITARGVPIGCPPPGGCHAELGAVLDGMSVVNGFQIESSDIVHTSSIDAYTRLDSVNLGRMMGILDLTVNTPAPTDRAGGGGPSDGLLERSSGVLLSGTVPLPPVDADSPIPPSASAYPGPTVKVSVEVDLSVVDGRLHIEATGFYTGPERHIDSDVAPDLRSYVLSRFTTTLPRLPMPWNVTPTRAHSEGSDVVLAGTQGESDLVPRDF